MTGPDSALTRALLDDAAIFPPGNAPMRVAVTSHLHQLIGPLAPMLGPFAVSDQRLAELTDILAALGVLTPLDISLVVSSGSDLAQLLERVPAFRDISLEAIEVKVGSAEEAAAVAETAAQSHAALYLECHPSEPAFGSVVAEARRHRVRMKFRTGGTAAEAFPTAAELAQSIQDCVRAGVPFKCTAGLHRAVRHRDAATGFEHHGFLNVLLAAATADHLAVDVIASVLDATDSATILTGLGSLGADGIALARRRFVSFGTCSVTEPVDDLVALRLLARPTGVAA